MSEVRDENISHKDIFPKNNRSYAFSKIVDHPSGYKVDIIDPYSVSTKFSKIYNLSHTEKYGDSTYSILTAYGYSHSELEMLEKEMVISSSWAEEYLPA